MIHSILFNRFLNKKTKTFFFSLGLFLLTPFLFVAQQSEIHVFEDWITFKGTQDMYHHSKTITDSQRNVYVVGSSINTFGNYDIMVVKYNRKGTLIWEDHINGSANGDDYGADLILDNSSHLIVTGTVLNTGAVHDMILKKYNASNGAVVWTEFYNGAANLIDGGTALAVSPSDDVFVGGGTSSITTQTDFLIMKYNSSGTQQWVNTYDYVNYQEVVTKIEYNGSTVLVTGASESNPGKWEMAVLKANVSNGVIVSNYRTGGNAESIDKVTDIIADDNGDIYVVGAVENLTTGYDMKIVKLDENLNLIWSREINGADNLNDEAHAVQVDGSYNVYVTGFITSATSGKDYYTCKYNSSGTQQWNVQYDGEAHQDDYGKDLVLDGAGNIYVTGSSFTISNMDYYTTKYKNSNGATLWAINYNSYANGDDQVMDITLDDNEDIIVVGQADLFGSTKYATVKYIQEDVITPPDNESSPVALSYRKNCGQVFTPQGNQTDIRFYNTTTTPSTYYGEDEISFLMASIDSTNTDSLHRIDMVFNKSNQDQIFYPIEKTAYYESFYQQHIPHNKRERVPTYNNLVSFDIFTKVDVMFTHNTKGTKFYLICKPGFNPADLSWEMTGHNGLSVNGSGDLNIATSLGTFSFVKGEAFNIDSQGNRVAMSWQPTFATSGNNVDIGTGSFNTTQTLVLEFDQGTDALTGGGNDIENLQWSTYVGSDQKERGNEIDIADNGFFSVAGSIGFTTFPDFINESEENGNDENLGTFESYLIRFNPIGAPVWGVYYGTEMEEYGDEVVVDIAGNSYLAGHQSFSNIFDLPFTDGFQSTGGGGVDAFVCKINQFGLLQWSTYFGGAGLEEIHDMTLQPSTGNIYIGGKTNSPSGIPLLDDGGYYRSTGNSGTLDGFLAGISSSGNLLWSTYFGNFGESGAYTEIGSIVIDETNSNRLMITGMTNGSSNTIVNSPFSGFTGGFPICDPFGLNPYIDETLAGSFDAFISEFDLSNNHKLIWSTLYGGDGDESFQDHGEIATIYQFTRRYDAITGTATSATNLNLMAGPPNSYNQTTYAGGDFDVFVAHFQDRALTWSSLLGSAGGEVPKDIKFDTSRNLYVMGATSLSNSTLPADYCDVPTNGGFPLCNAISNTYFDAATVSTEQDIFITAFDRYFEMKWSTFFGGDKYDLGMGLTINRNTNLLFMTGRTGSHEDEAFPLNPWLPQSHYQDIYSGHQHDAFLSKFDIEMFDINYIGIEEEPLNQSNDLRIFPNPTSSLFQLYFLMPQSDITIEIYDNIGKLILTKYLGNITQGQKVKIDITEFDSGIYYLNIPNMDHYERKIIKQ